MAEQNDDLRSLIGSVLQRRESERQSVANRPEQRATEKPQPQRSQSRGNRPAGYRFLNPYNFVRGMDAPKVTDLATALLGRCAPPPHDRYVGLSGEIQCELEVVSPLFIADSELPENRESDAEKDHKTYRFFRYDFGEGYEPALPASSLRGMLRTIFEVATNSCFAHFDYSARLSYHLPAAEALKLVPARIEQTLNGGWTLRLLPGTSRLAVGDRPRDKLYAARVERYDALVPGRRRTASGRPSATKSQPVALNGLEHGCECFALVEELKFPPVWHVVALSKEKSQLPRPASGQRVFCGYVSLNNQNIESKRFERFFFRDSQNNSGPEVLPLLDSVREKYDELMADYHTRHNETVQSWRRQEKDPAQPRIERDAKGKLKKQSAFSRFLVTSKRETKAKHGDLVYVMLSGNIRSPQVEYIVPVAIPRVGYERKVADLLPRHLWKCEEYDSLCPACRAFGWVYGHEERRSLPPSEQAAYAGRIRLGHGRLIETQRPTPPTLPSTTLAILSTPKPTTSRFYLQGKSGPQSGQSDYQAGYDNPGNSVRGRKMYRYFGERLNPQEYHSTGGHKSDQNRTIEGALAPGARFTFAISFENLSPVELGALLWSIQLEGEQVHRLGMGKPLGFGSVRMKLPEDSICVFDPEERYQSMRSSALHTASDSKQEEWIGQYKESMQKAYASPFTQIPNIHDLLVLLSQPAPDLPIHYPRPDSTPSVDGMNFEWFMGNSRNREARLVLEVPGEEMGFPLIDKYGNIRE